MFSHLIQSTYNDNPYNQLINFIVSGLLKLAHVLHLNKYEYKTFQENAKCWMG